MAYTPRFSLPSSGSVAGLQHYDPDPPPHAASATPEAPACIDRLVNIADAGLPLLTTGSATSSLVSRLFMSSLSLPPAALLSATYDPGSLQRRCCWLPSHTVTSLGGTLTRKIMICCCVRSVPRIENNSFGTFFLKLSLHLGLAGGHYRIRLRLLRRGSCAVQT